MKHFLIDLLAFAALFSSVLVITSKNPVITVIFLNSGFLGDFDINKIYSYLDGLSLHQEGALFNILVLLVILLTVFSILGVFFGNEIIKYFDLENKYPRLSYFFKVRAKLQRYYLMWNIFILFSLSFFALFMNILAFSIG